MLENVPKVLKVFTNFFTNAKIGIFLLDMTTFSEMASESLEVKAGHAAIFSVPAIASEPAPSVTWQSEVG